MWLLPAKGVRAVRKGGEQEEETGRSKGLLGENHTVGKEGWRWKTQPLGTPSQCNLRQKSREKQQENASKEYPEKFRANEVGPSIQVAGLGRAE